MYNQVDGKQSGSASSNTQSELENSQRLLKEAVQAAASGGMFFAVLGQDGNPTGVYILPTNEGAPRRYHETRQNVYVIIIPQEENNGPDTIHIFEGTFYADYRLQFNSMPPQSI